MNQHNELINELRLIAAHSWGGGRPLSDAANAIEALEREVEGLRTALKKANDQAEHFERQWYLRGDAIETLEAEIARGKAHANIIREGLKSMSAIQHEGASNG